MFHLEGLFLFVSGAQNYDVIRFATYRAACKLRFIQKKTNREYQDATFFYKNSIH